MDRRFEYKMINGQPGSSVFWHMLQHVVNHASYHRGHDNYAAAGRGRTAQEHGPDCVLS
jgi:uncharacterized damage-inducible protein DinB